MKYKRESQLAPSRHLFYNLHPHYFNETNMNPPRSNGNIPQWAPLFLKWLLSVATCSGQSRETTKVIEQANSGSNVSHKCFFFRHNSPTRGQGRPISWCFHITHNDTTHSVGLLWRRDRHVAGNSTWQNTTLTRERHWCLWWDSNPQSQQVIDLRPLGHWHRRIIRVTRF